MQMSCGLLRRLGIGKMRSQWITATVAAAASFKLIYSLDIQFFRMNMQIGEELSVRGLCCALLVVIALASLLFSLCLLNNEPAFSFSFFLPWCCPFGLLCCALLVVIALGTWVVRLQDGWRWATSQSSSSPSHTSLRWFIPLSPSRILLLLLPKLIETMKKSCLNLLINLSYSKYQIAQSANAKIGELVTRDRFLVTVFLFFCENMKFSRAVDWKYSINVPFMVN